MTLPVVTLTAFYHRHVECIGIYFIHSAELNKIMQQAAGAKWSQTKRCWYIPLSKENHKQLINALTGKVLIEQSQLRQYLTDKKKKKMPEEKYLVPATVQQPIPVEIKKETTVYKNNRIHHVNAHVLPQMEQQLQLKAYSASTRRTYINEMAQLLVALKNIPADELTVAQLKRYFVYCFEKPGLKENTMHSRMNALYPVGLK